MSELLPFLAFTDWRTSAEAREENYVILLSVQFQWVYCTPDIHRDRTQGPTHRSSHAPPVRPT